MTITLISQVSVGQYILWPSKFASYLEDYLLLESCTWDDRSVSLRDWHCKLYLALYHCPVFKPGCAIVPMALVFIFWRRKNKFLRHRGAENKKKIRSWKIANSAGVRQTTSLLVFILHCAFYTCTGRSVPDIDWFPHPIAQYFACRTQETS